MDTTELRVPRFLAQAGSSDVRAARFGAEPVTRGPAAPAFETTPQPVPAAAPAPPPPAPAPEPLTEEPSPPEGQRADAHAGPPPRSLDEVMARVADAVHALRRESEHLAGIARADAIELGFQVARRIVELQLAQRPEVLFSLVQSALRRLGEAREVVVRLAPEDAALVKADKGRSAFTGVRVAKVRIVADPTLSRGDCIVESDAGQVDGRLDTRLREVRGAVEGDAVHDEELA